MKKLNLKKLFVFSMLAVMPFSLAGCELSDLTAFDKNMDKYLNQTVATATAGDNTLKITLEDLIFAYNNYGYDYENTNGMTREEAIKETLEKEVQRKLAIQEAKKLYANTLTNAEKNIIWEKTYSTLNSQLARYEEEIRKEKGYPAINNPAEEEKTSDGTAKESYTPKAFVVNGEIVLNQELINNGYTGNPNVPLIGNTENMYDSFMANRNITTEEVSNLALTRYIKNLKINEEGRRLSTVDKEVFTREIERIYEIEEGNFYIEKLETEYYKQNLISEEEVLDYYKALVRSSYDKYKLNLEDYYSDMKSDATKVYYHPNNEFKYVTHILVQYTDEQKELIKSWEKDLESGRISQVDYDANMAWIKTQLSTKARDSEGNFYGEEKSLNAIFNEVKNAVNNSENKAATFNDYIYKYNSDPGIMNTDYNYVVGDNHSSMVAEFNETCRNLFELDKLQIVNQSTNIAYTEYGAHIIMYVDDVKNPVSYSNLDNVTIEKLASVKLQAGEDKTLFNKLYDDLYSSISSNKFAEYQSNLIETLQDGIKITFYKKVYKELM